MSAESTTPLAAASSPRTRWNSFEVWLAVLALVSAVNGLAEKSPSVAFFGVVTAAVALTAKLGQSPLQLTHHVRRLFYHSARLARGLLIVLAVGGTFLVFDVTYKGFDPLPEWCDVWVKRAAPGLIVLTVVATGPATEMLSRWPWAPSCTLTPASWSSFSPDGSRIVYRTTSDGYLTSALWSGVTGLFVVSGDTGYRIGFTNLHLSTLSSAVTSCPFISHSYCWRFRSSC